MTIYHQRPYIVAIWKGPRLITHKVCYADDEKDAYQKAKASYEKDPHAEQGVEYHPKLSELQDESPKGKGKRPKFRLT